MDLQGKLVGAVLLVLPWWAAAGCGGGPLGGSPPPPPLPDPPGTVARTAGGSRLQAVFAEAAEGTDQFLGWHDRELDAWCEFDTLTDGQRHCRPSGADAALIGESANPVFFADERCSEPVVGLPLKGLDEPGCAAPRFVFSMARDCQRRTEVFQVGAPVSAARLYRGSSASCAPVAVPSESQDGQFVSLRPVNPATLVAATEEVGAERDGIVPAYLVASDGARTFIGFRDAKDGFDCTVRPTEDGERCVPTDTELIAATFADPGCTEMAAWRTSECRMSVPFALDAQALIANKWVVYEGGPQVPALFSGAGPSQCTMVMSSQGGFQVGAMILPSRFVTGQREAIPRAAGLIQGQMRAGGWTQPGSAPLASNTFGGFSCALLPTPDGVTRCVPLPTSGAIYYSDDRCQQPVAANQRSPLALLDTTTCPMQVRLFTRGEPHQGDVFGKDAAGACVAIGPPPNRSARVVYESFAQPVPLTEFAAIRVVKR